MNELDTIKATINSVITNEGMTVDRLILFGSRARGTAKIDSDWDLLIIVEKAITFPEVKRISGKIQLALAKKKIYNDILIRSAADYEASKEFVGNISYYAAREGVTV